MNVERLPALPDDPEWEHWANLKRIEYEHVGCAWGCQNYYVSIQGDGSIEFTGVPAHANLKQFEGKAQYWTQGFYKGFIDVRLRSLLSDFIVRHEVYKLNGQSHEGITDAYSTYLSITYKDYPSSSIYYYGNSNTYEISLVEYLVEQSIETASYQPESPSLVQKSAFVTQNGKRIRITDMSKNEALIVAESMESLDWKKALESLSGPPSPAEDVARFARCASQHDYVGFRRVEDKIEITYRPKPCGDYTLTVTRSFCGRPDCELFMQSLHAHRVGGV